MSFLQDFKRLSGLTNTRSRDVLEARAQEISGLAEATDLTIGIIKKLAKKTKMGDYDIREVHEALNTIDPGWKLEITVGAMPVKDGPLHPGLNLDVSRAFEAKYGLSHTDMTYYGPTSASLSWAWKTGAGGDTHSQTASKARPEKPSKGEIETTTKAFLDLVFDGIIQQKDPPNPMPGQTYIAPLGKPKVDEGPNPHVEGVMFYSLTWKIASVRRGVEVTRLTSPKGEVIDLEGPSPSLWTRLYKTDIDKKAQSYIDNEGIVAKDAQKKAMKGYSSNDVVGTCGICHNIQKLRNHQLVLHGYTRPGYGWIHGSCFGVGYEAWELSPESVEDYIKHLAQAIPNQRDHIADLKSTKSFDVMIDDKFLVKGSGQGYRKYRVTKDGFELADEKKYAHSELSKMGIPKAYDVWSLDDPKVAAKVFTGRKDAAVKGAEDNLKQMLQVKKECEQAVAGWTKQSLPGATLEAVSQMRRLMGLR